VGTVLAERYRIDALLGEGGMGRVYAAEHVLMRKRLAIKVLHRELTTVPEVVARFEREAMAAANIEHANVAAATDFGKLADGSVFLVLEFVQGKNLRDEIAIGPFSEARALHIARQIASALGSAHALSIVHRDLKPENVMLVERAGDPDFVKVLDFGIAKVPIGEVGRNADGDDTGPTPITKAGMVFGTPEYMAPEQALGQTVDGRADLYALGVILFEMLAGIRPFSSKSQVGILGQQLSKPPPTFSERAPGIVVSPHIEQLVHKLLAREVADRFQSASEVVAAIDSLVGLVSVRGVRMFTQASGSPREVMGSQPGIAPIDQRPLPSWADDHSWPGSPASTTGPQSLGSDPRAALSSNPLLPDNRLISGTGGEPGDPLVSAPAPREGLDASRLQDRARRGVDRVLDWIDERRNLLPPAARRAVRKVPTQVFLGAAILACFAVVGGLLAAVILAVRPTPTPPLSPSNSARSSAAPTPSTALSPPSAAPTRVSTVHEPTGPTEAEIATARAAGSEALERLSTRFPKHPGIALALAQTYAKEKKHAQAVGAIGRVLAADSQANADPQIARILFVGAQAKDSHEAAFTLLAGPMGAPGADIVYDLATTDGVRGDVKARAERWLRSKEFDRLSSPQLNIAVALRFATTCKQRHGLLLRAKNVGDERSLVYLKQFPAAPGNACLKEDKRLDDAVRAIEQRRKKK
jgi:serine/threonine-protein kinase